MFERVSVLVLPGLAASDVSTAALRTALTAQGHRVHGWKLGRNSPSPELSDALRSRFFDVADRYDRPIALVGWSLGGLYAHRLAEFAPNRVRSVITLGSPLNRDGTKPALAVPTTSVYSRNDRVVGWRHSLVDDDQPHHENVEVRSNHFMLGFDPAVMLVVSDRLRTHPERWKRFRPPPLSGLMFPSPGQTDRPT